MAKRSNQKKVTPEPSIAVLDPSPDEVSRLAHQYWLERGAPAGSSEDDWFRAEEELRLRRRPEQERDAG